MTDEQLMSAVEQALYEGEAPTDFYRSDINERIEAQIMKHIDWLVKNMPFAPPPWATKTLRNLLKQLEEVKK